MSIYIDVAKTAIEHEVSNSIKLLEKMNVFYPTMKILDWGSGYGSNAKYLRDKGYEIVEFDPYIREEKEDPPRWIKYNLVLSINVLNVMSKKFERKTLVEEMWDRVAPKGILFIEVELDSFLEKRKNANWSCYNDGFLSEDFLFYKGFSNQDLEKLCKNLSEVQQAGFLNSKDICSIYLRKNTIVSSERRWTLEDWEKVGKQ